jgi:hypothetical protein
MRKLGLVLLGVALVVGMAGCFTPFRVLYQLTISNSEGGKVTAPGEGIFNYWEGTVIDLVAEAEDGYLFASWTGNVSTVGNVTSAATTITMDCNYCIAADFASVMEVWDWGDLDTVRNDLGCGYILMNDLDSGTAEYDELASPTANGAKDRRPIRACSRNRLTVYWDVRPSVLQGR